MDIGEINSLEQRLVKSIKHNCLLCHARRAFERPENPEKELVLASLDALAETCENKYNAVRKADAKTEKINAAHGNKRIVLDAKDTCLVCDREVDRANRLMSQLK